MHVAPRVAARRSLAVQQPLRTPPLELGVPSASFVRAPWQGHEVGECATVIVGVCVCIGAREFFSSSFRLCG